MSDDAGQVRPGRDWRVSLTSDTGKLAGLREHVSRAAACVGFEEPEVSQIVLAVDEAIGNVIKHGYDGRPGQPIEVTIGCTEHGGRPALRVVIEDCGRQVDPESIVGRKLDDVRPGGLGTHIIRNIMDEVSYSLRRPQGMCLCMVKALGREQDGQGPRSGEEPANG